MMIPSARRLHAPATFVRRGAALAVLIGLAAAVAAAQPADTGATTPGAVEKPEPIIPPGREEVLSAMLGAAPGATLPGGCVFVNGDVKHSIVEATYQCGDAQVVFELAHPTSAHQTAVVTDKFAIALKSGAPPAELAAILAERVRAGEGDFEWEWTVPYDSTAAVQGGQTWILEIALIALAGIGFLGWTLRRRSKSAID